MTRTGEKKTGTPSKAQGRRGSKTSAGKSSAASSGPSEKTLRNQNEAASSAPEDKPENKPEKKESSLPAWILWLLILLAALGGLIWLQKESGQQIEALLGMQKPAPEAMSPPLSSVSPAVSPAVSRAPSSPDFVPGDDLQSRLADLSSLVAEQAAALSSQKETISSLEDKISGFQASLSSGNEAENRALSQRLNDLETQIEGLEKLRRTDNIRPWVRMVAVAQLREAILSGRPFTQELDLMVRASKGDEGQEQILASLSPYQGQGITDLAALRSAFPPLATHILKVGMEDGSVWGWLKKQLASLISIRRTGMDVVGNTPEAILARTQSLLAKGDLSSAVKEMEGLSGQSAQTAESWLAGAKARVSAMKNLAALSSDSVKNLDMEKAKETSGPVDPSERGSDELLRNQNEPAMAAP